MYRADVCSICCATSLMMALQRVLQAASARAAHRDRVLVGREGDGPQRPVQHQLDARQRQAHRCGNRRRIPPDPLAVLIHPSECELQLRVSPQPAFTHTRATGSKMQMLSSTQCMPHADLCNESLWHMRRKTHTLLPQPLLLRCCSGNGLPHALCASFCSVRHVSIAQHALAL